MRKRSILPLMPAPCRTCPFGGAEPLPLDEAKISQITAYLLRGVNHECHTPQLKGKLPTHTCRGGRNLTLKAWAAAGIIDAPTDEALERAMLERGITPAPANRATTGA